MVRPAPDGSKVYVGGAFDTLGGITSWAVGLVDSAQGALLPFPGSDGGSAARTTCCATTVRDIITDQNTVYFANSGDGGGCFDGTWAADLTSGALKWKNNCLGATEAIALVGRLALQGLARPRLQQERSLPPGTQPLPAGQRPDDGKLGRLVPPDQRGRHHQGRSAGHGDRWQAAVGRRRLHHGQRRRSSRV